MVSMPWRWWCRTPSPIGKRRTFWTPIIASLQPHEVKPTVAPPTWLTARVRQWPFEYLVTLHQDSVDLSRAQALAFQFQLPGPSETWLDGATAPVGAPTAETCQLSVKGTPASAVPPGIAPWAWHASDSRRKVWKSCVGSAPPSGWSRRCWRVWFSVGKPPVPRWPAKETPGLWTGPPTFGYGLSSGRHRNSKDSGRRPRRLSIGGVLPRKTLPPVRPTCASWNACRSKATPGPPGRTSRYIRLKITPGYRRSTFCPAVPDKASGAGRGAP